MFRQTGAVRGGLLGTLARAGNQIDVARRGAEACRPIAAELDVFRAEHDRLVTEVAQRIESALENGQLAVDAYERGDAQMAEQYGRASVVFVGDRLPPVAPSPGTRALVTVSPDGTVSGVDSPEEPVPGFVLGPDAHAVPADGAAVPVPHP